MFTLVLLLVAAAVAVVPKGHKSTPWGPIKQECHHSVPSGSVLERNADGGLDVLLADGSLHSKLPKCAYAPKDMFATHKKRQFPSDYDGWLAYTQWQYPGASQSIDAFTGYFSVPDAPSSTPDVLYVFTGLQDDDWVPIVDPTPTKFDIIQPVLQYPADSGSGWSAKSWFVTLDIGAIASNEISFATNASVVFGNMTRTGVQSYFVDSVNPATRQSTHITVKHARLATQAWAFTTIECYGCTDTFGANGCSYLPQTPIHFTKMLLTARGRTITPTWQALVSPNPICNTAANIISPQKVDYNFQ
jgi:hypothetical protein